MANVTDLAPAFSIELTRAKALTSALIKRIDAFPNPRHVPSLTKFVFEYAETLPANEQAFVMFALGGYLNT